MADELREHLAAFGLSAKERDVYVALVEAGAATTGDLATAADVSQGYVYEVAGALADRGLVTVDESTTPTTVRARPPEEATDALRERLDALEASIEARYAGGTGEVGFEVVRSRATVRRRATDALDAATDEVFLVVPATEFAALRESLAAAVDRGVFVYCMLVAPDLDATLAAVEDPGRYADVLRAWDATPPALVLADERRGVMGGHDILSGRHGDSYALSFSQPEVASGFFGNALSNAWPMGEPVHVSDPDPLPATYDLLRTGVTQAALHTAAGRDLAADVTARDTATGETREFERAPVVDVRQSLVGDSTAAFPMENALVLAVDGERHSVGNDRDGIGAYYEDYAARGVTLHER